MRIVLLVLLMLPLAAAAPEQVHVTLTARAEEAGDAPPSASRLALTWHESQGYLPTDSPQAEVRIDGGSPVTVMAEVVGQTTETFRPGQPPVGFDTDGSDLIHAAFVDAPFGSNVTYKVGDPRVGWSDEFTVRMVPASQHDLRIVAFGDIGGFTLEGSDNSVQVAVMELARSLDPDLVIIPGDLAYANTDEIWGQWLDMMQPLFANHIVMPVPGNHEWQTSLEGYDQFKARFVLPEQLETQIQTDEISSGPVRNRNIAEEFYAYSAGDVYFVALNSDRACTKPEAGADLANIDDVPPCQNGAPEARQIAFLRDALEDAREDLQPRWIISYFHHPPYSYGNHWDDPAVKGLWVPELETFNVDLVVTAHDHNYQRSHAMRGGVPVATETPYPHGAGPMYVVTGGGGRSLYEIQDPPLPAWMASHCECFHLTLIEASNQALKVTALEAPNGTVIDTFTIQLGDSDGSAEPAGKDSPMPFLLLGALLALWRRR